MKKLAAITRPLISPNTIRLQRVFAWRPVYIDGYWIWLEYYEILQAYLVKQVQLYIDGKDVKFTVGEWENIAKRIITK